MWKILILLSLLLLFASVLFVNPLFSLLFLGAWLIGWALWAQGKPHE